MPALTDKHLHSLLANSNFISVKRIPFFSSVYLYYIFNRYYCVFSFVNIKLGKGRYFRTEESDDLCGRLGDRAAPPAGASDGHGLREGPGSTLKAQFCEAGSGGRGPGSQRGSGEKPTREAGGSSQPGLWEEVGPRHRRRMRIAEPEPARRGRHCWEAFVRAWLAPAAGPAPGAPSLGVIGSGIRALITFSRLGRDGRRRLRRQGAEPPAAPFVCAGG